MGSYDGKKIVIIGGTSGIGLTTAQMLVKGGARVLVTGRSQSALDSTQAELGQNGTAVQSDARSLTDLDALATRVEAEFGTIDLLFVNAGYSLFAPIETVNEATYDEVFNLNAKGPFFAAQKLASLIHQGGSIVFTTAIANVKGMPLLAAYGGAKAAMRSFARTFAAELAPQGIRVNAVSPGPIDTPIIGKSLPDKAMAAHVVGQFRDTSPLKRIGTSEEVAKAVLFLAFDATYTTGAEFPVDGGLSQL
ncbi:SDR family oxidoreductase [Sphingomonas sp. PAMC 26605]|uniref:SDR family oxidoreductase n=1 Tax=Sphingomonas sp. PAMC 26605 TaxID=1112214 RepID=UPI00026CCADA|nr:SDR family oxidoreductase [Sphingomonas sp. PAMC 26605]